jgi:copper chaperone CopZ
VTFRDKEARVTFDPDRVSVEQLIDAVNRLGFRAAIKQPPSSR